VCVVIQTVTYIFQMSDYIHNYNNLMAVWIIRQIAIYQSQTSIWKIVKLRLECLDIGNDAENLAEINVTVSRIGNFGDISSDSYEIFFLGVASLTPLAHPSFGNEQMKLTIYLAVLICNVITLVLSCTFTKSQLTPAWKKKEVEMETPGKAEITAVVARVESRTPSILDPKEWTIYLARRLGYLWRNRVAFHTLMHYLILLVFYTIVSFPLTLSVSNSLSINTPTSDFVCDGLISYLLTQGFVLNCTYLVTTLMYTAFLVRCPPLIFYRYVFFGLAIVLGVSVGILWMPMSQWPTFIFVSLAQCIPYYLYSFDFYVFTSSIDEIYYGFIYGVYGFMYQLLYIVPSSILYAPYTNNELIISSLVLLVICMVYAVIIAVYFKEELKSKPPEAFSHPSPVSDRKDIESSTTQLKPPKEGEEGEAQEGAAQAQDETPAEE